MTAQTWIVGLTALGLGTAVFGQDEAAPAEEKKEEKKPAWESSVALGLTYTDGNSRTLQINGQVESHRKWEKHELDLNASGGYGENQGEQTVGYARGSAQYNRLFTERFFGYFRVEAVHDAIADVAYRVGLSPGAGYYFIKTEKTALRGEAGPGVIFEKQGGVSDTYATLRLAERFDHKFNDRAKLWQTLEYLPQVEDFNNFLINAEIGIETSISKSLSQRTYLQDTYDSQPAPDRKKNDVRIVAAIAYKF